MGVSAGADAGEPAAIGKAFPPCGGWGTQAGAGVADCASYNDPARWWQTGALLAGIAVGVVIAAF
ncbi:MAG: hypothetical protein OXE82_02060 [Rhodobacter sp.]|nr:hypothetical protein [Rhodobacter sp.]